MGAAAPPPLRRVQAYGRTVRMSSGVAFALSWLVTVVMAWREVLGVPDGRGDLNGLSSRRSPGSAGSGC